MSQMNYDKGQPNYIPIIVSVIVTIVLIIIMTIALVYYFKGSLVQYESKQIINSGNTIELDQIREYEETYLYEESSDKVTIDEAITIINNRYN